MMVTKTKSGWAVSSGPGENEQAFIRDGFTSHAAAWRWIDRQQGEPISRGESFQEYLYEKHRRDCGL